MEQSNARAKRLGKDFVIFAIFCLLSFTPAVFNDLGVGALALLPFLIIITPLFYLFIIFAVIYFVKVMFGIFNILTKKSQENTQIGSYIDKKPSKAVRLLLMIVLSPLVFITTIYLYAVLTAK